MRWTRFLRKARSDSSLFGGVQIPPGRATFPAAPGGFGRESGGFRGSGLLQPIFLRGGVPSRVSDALRRTHHLLSSEGPGVRQPARTASGWPTAYRYGQGAEPPLWGRRGHQMVGRVRLTATNATADRMNEEELGPLTPRSTALRVSLRVSSDPIETGCRLRWNCAQSRGPGDVHQERRATPLGQRDHGNRHARSAKKVIRREGRGKTHRGTHLLGNLRVKPRSQERRIVAKPSGTYTQYR